MKEFLGRITRFRDHIIIRLLEATKIEPDPITDKIIRVILASEKDE